jgi:hypothetical protein
METQAAPSAASLIVIMTATAVRRSRTLVSLAVLLCAMAAVLPAQNESASPDAGPAASPFYCPMDPEIRAKLAGKCSKCGMDLVLGVAEPVEYVVKLRLDPPAVEPGEPVELAFEIIDPRDGQRARAFSVVHDKLFHLLYVSHDLEVFGHEHPMLGGDGIFRLNTVFPKGAAYRLLTDFYPGGATPQMIPLTVTTAGFEQSLEESLGRLQADRQPQRGENLTISLRTEPAEPVAALKTLLFFDLDTAEGLEPFLGAWAHMLAVSEDLVDMIHAHPAIAAGGPLIQMNVIFPRPGMYRIWVQAQRDGKLNTVSFTVPVRNLD